MKPYQYTAVYVYLFIEMWGRKKSALFIGKQCSIGAKAPLTFCPADCVIFAVEKLNLYLYDSASYQWLHN